MFMNYIFAEIVRKGKDKDTMPRVFGQLNPVMLSGTVSLAIKCPILIKSIISGCLEEMGKNDYSSF